MIRPASSSTTTTPPAGGDIGLRDCALTKPMVYSLARIGSRRLRRYSARRKAAIGW